MDALLSPSSALVRAFLAKRTTTLTTVSSSAQTDDDDAARGTTSSSSSSSLEEETTLIAREFDGVTVRCSIPKGIDTKKALISLAFPRAPTTTTPQRR